jgi:hypothetical protein
MDYRKKYMKYKQKYISLLLGGANLDLVPVAYIRYKTPDKLSKNLQFYILLGSATNKSIQNNLLYFEHNGQKYSLDMTDKSNYPTLRMQIMFYSKYSCMNETIIEHTEYAKSVFGDDYITSLLTIASGLPLYDIDDIVKTLIKVKLDTETTFKIIDLSREAVAGAGAGAVAGAPPTAAEAKTIALRKANDAVKAARTKLELAQKEKNDAANQLSLAIEKEKNAFKQLENALALLKLV